MPPDDDELLRQVGEMACRAETSANFTMPPYLQGRFYCGAMEDEPIATQVLAAISFGFLMAVAVVGNSVVMWIISQHKIMHHGFNYFLFNMALADLLIALFNVGTSWTYNLYYNWWYGDLCILTSFFGIAPTTVSVFSMMALSWDRCQAVVNPLRKRPLSRRRSLFAIIFIWLLSTFSALPFALSATVTSIFSYDIATFEISRRSVCASPVSPVFDRMLFVMQYAIPLCVLSFTFARIAWAFSSTDLAIDNNSKCSSHTRAKSKAVKMLGLMVIAFMFCWLPYHLYHTFELSNIIASDQSKYIYLMIYWIAMSSSAYNPIIYCFANERFRIGFRYVFRWIPWVECKKENYEYSQLFPERMRSMAISLQKGRGNNNNNINNNNANNNSVGNGGADKKLITKDFSTAGFTCQSTPDIVQCVLNSENNKHLSKSALLADCQEDN